MAFFKWTSSVTMTVIASLLITITLFAQLQITLVQANPVPYPIPASETPSNASIVEHNYFALCADGDPTWQNSCTSSPHKYHCDANGRLRRKVYDSLCEIMCKCETLYGCTSAGIAPVGKICTREEVKGVDDNETHDSDMNTGGPQTSDIGISNIQQRQVDGTKDTDSKISDLEERHELAEKEQGSKAHDATILPKHLPDQPSEYSVNLIYHPMVWANGEFIDDPNYPPPRQ